MPEDTKKDKKEKTLSLKTNTTSSKSTIGARSRGGSRVSTVVVESKRGKISKTRKPSAPNIKTRTSSVTSRKIKEPTEEDVFGSLTDKERVAREKALLDADTRKKDLANFSLSNAVLRPFFFITVNSLIWTLSKVVNLIPPLHVQDLLLLIAVPSSVGLESITEVSLVLQNGQSIIYL